LACQYTTNALPLTILASPSVVLTASASSPICSGDLITFTASPSGYSNYSFYNGSTILQSSSSTILISSLINVGNGNNISVVATNSNGCKSISSNVLNFNVLPAPTISLTCSDADLTICDGDPVTFTAAPLGLNFYQFFNNSSAVQNSISRVFITSGLIPGNSITVIGTDNNGCKSLASNSISVAIKPKPNVFITASDTTLCIGSSTTLTQNQNPIFVGTTYSWSTGSTNSSITVSPAKSTNYILNSTLNGCSGIPDTIIILVDNDPLPIASAGLNKTICKGDSVALTGSGGISYAWSPSIGLSNTSIAKPKASPSATTIYTLKTTNLYCSDVATVEITIDLCLNDIDGPIPTCITPNGDGTNDLFIIPNVDYFKKNSLVIYNRWGNVIYKQAPYINDWDGKSMNGNDLPDAVYYYILDLGNDKKTHTGYVLIHR
jgi:gliding motility-associated-like protein